MGAKGLNPGSLIPDTTVPSRWGYSGNSSRHIYWDPVTSKASS